MFLLICSLLATPDVAAQPRLAALALPENVAGRAINDLYLDDAGFLWLVSGSRLFRFDGEQARPVLDQSQLPVGAAAVIALREQAGQMYVLTETHFARIVGSDELQSLAVASATDASFSVALARSQHWLLGTQAGDLRVVGPDATEARLPALEGRMIALLASGPTSAIAFAADGSFRQLHWRNGRWSMGRLRQLRLPAGDRGSLLNVALTDQGRVLAAVAGRGLFASLLTESIERDNLIELELQPLLVDIDVNAIAVHGEAILVGTDRGLHWLPVDATDESQLRIYDTGNSALAHEEILSLHSLESGRVALVGTFEGVAVLRDVPFALTPFGKANKQRLQVMADWEPDAVLLGTYAGMQLYRTETATVEPAPLTEGGFTDHRVMSLGVSPDYLIRGYRSRGLDVIARKEGALLAHIDRQSHPDLGADGVSLIASLGPERWLLGTYGGGSAILELQDGVVQLRSLALPKHGRSQYVVQYCEVNQQWMLITEAGPYVVQSDTLVPATAVVFPSSEPHPSRFWLCHQDDRGRLWLAGDGGELIAYAPEQVAAVLRGEAVIPAQRFALAQEILAMRSDSLNNLWAVTRNNLLLVPADGSLVEQFGGAQGMPDLVFSYGSALRSASGVILFGSSAGVFRVDPEGLMQSAQRRDLRLSWFRNDGSRFKPTDVFQLPTSLEVRHPSQFFAVGLFAGSALQRGAVRFRHRLEGLDEDWLYSDSGSISYSQLPAGNYRLRVQTSLDQQAWPDAEWSIPVRVSGDPLRTPWARALLLALLILLLILLTAWWQGQRRQSLLGIEVRGARGLAERALSGLQSTLQLRQRLLRELVQSSVSSYESLVRLTLQYAQQEPEDASFTVARLRAVQKAQLLSFAEGDRVLLDLQRWLEAYWPELLRILDNSQEPVLLNAIKAPPLDLGRGLDLVSLLTELLLISLTESLSPLQNEARLRLALEVTTDGSGYILELNDNGEAVQRALGLFAQTGARNPAEQRAADLGLILTASAAVQRQGLDVSAWLDKHWFEPTGV